MTGRLAGACFAIGLGGVLCGQPAPDTQAVETATTTVRGRLRSAQDGRPLKGAKVSIINPSGIAASSYSAFDGSFEVEDAPVGIHTIHVLKGGYEDFQEGVAIPGGQPLEGVDLRLRKLSVVAGRVTDENEQPVEGARVEALREQFLEGRLRFRSRGPRGPVGNYRTDDRGLYRIFGLSAGEYRIAVTPKEQPATDGQIRFKRRMAYFPNSESMQDAGPVSVGWGEEKQGMDVRLETVPATMAEGRVFVADKEKACERCYLELYRSDGPAKALLGRTQTTDRGFFSVVGLPAGEYVMKALWFDRQTSQVSFGSETFLVSEGRPEAVVVEIFGERKITGRMILRDPPESVAADEAKAWTARVRLAPDSLDPTASSPTSGTFGQVKGIATEGAFEVSGVPGTYKLSVAPPAGGYVSEVKMGDRRLQSSKIRIPGRGPIDEMLVEIRFDSGKVAGSVRGEAISSHEETSTASRGGLLPRGPAVWLMPTDGAPQFSSGLSGFARMGIVQNGGAFEVSGVPPGEYTAYAFPFRAGYNLEDPKFKRRLASYGEKVSVKPGETTVVNLRAVPTLDELGQN